MAATIRLGQCWPARLTKCEMFVRIEDYSPKGGWLARSLSHGRMVRIHKADQLIHRCDENGLHIVADETEPNRRSTASPPEPVDHAIEPLAVEIEAPKVTKMPVRKAEPMLPQTFLFFDSGGTSSKNASMNSSASGPKPLAAMAAFLYASRAAFASASVALKTASSSKPLVKAAFAAFSFF